MVRADSPRTLGDRRDATVRRRDRCDPAARAAGQLVVGGARFIKDLERVQSRRRLTARTAQVGLQPVPEAAVGVAVAAQRLDDGLGRPVAEQHRVTVSIYQPGG